MTAVDGDDVSVSPPCRVSCRGLPVPRGTIMGVGTGGGGGQGGHDHPTFWTGVASDVVWPPYLWVHTNIRFNTQGIFDSKIIQPNAKACVLCGEVHLQRLLLSRIICSL